ncbi:peptidase M56 [Paenibacillus tritici]|uniref:Peptidase M56 n=1 Tax=Paenibacillus tritici TaxID=1873425 RepID=A0ABX2DLF1_9BACL|nr:M56 family metallopeptidase [Paenibacillus tritici]NQX44286.1 peptidase M56 [Paenibacillus tritici]
MNSLLEILCSLSVAGSVVTVSFHALGRLSTDHFPAKWRYVLLKLALALYLLPIALVLPWLSRLAAPHPANSTQNIQTGRVSGQIAETLQPAVTLSASTAYLLLGIWAAGAITFAAWQWYAYRRFTAQLERNRTMVPENSETAILLKNIKEQLGLTRSVKLAYSSIARSPFLAGLWRPTIYLPAQNHANLDMDMVLRHELVHLKRKDLWIKAGLLLVRTLHWYNPLVHTVRTGLHTWSELTCDQEVVQDMSHAERKRYGGTILNVMAGSKGLPEQFCASLSGDGKQLKRRLTHMLNVKKLNKQTLFLSVTAALLIAGISTSTAALASKVTPQVVPDSEYVASEAAAPSRSEGGLTVPAAVSVTVPAESSSAAAQQGTTAQPVPEPVPVPAGSVTVPAPAESVPAPAPAQQVTTAQPIPDKLAAVTVSAQEDTSTVPHPELVSAPAPAK